MPTEAQKRAWDKYRKSGKSANISLQMARRIYDDICAYAASRDLAPATCVRDCIRRCMALDGWPALPPVERSHPAMKETGIEQPAPRKRGRPRKNPAPLASDTSGENAPASVKPEQPAENAPALEATEQVQPAQLE